MRSILLVCFVCISFMSSTQSLLSVEALTGVDWLYSYWDLEGDHYPDEFTYRPGLSVRGGINYSIELNPTIQLSTGLHYNQYKGFRGYYVKIDTADVTYTVDPSEGNPIVHYSEEHYTTIHYVTMPITVDFKIKKFTIGIGGELNYMINDRIDYHNYIRIMNKDERSIYSKDHLSFNYTATVLGAYQLSNRIQLCLRGSMGFRDLQPHYTQPTRTIQVCGGIQYYIIKND